MKLVRFQSPDLSISANCSPNKSRNFGRVFSPKNLIFQSFFEKDSVGFGSPELSLRLSCTELSALSFGHGPRGLGFQGGPSGRTFVFLLGAVPGGQK